jgi:predicted ATPase
VEAGRFFDVTAQCGHVLELSGVELCDRLVSLGEYIQCPECFRCVKVVSIADGRVMTPQEKEKQARDYQVWKEEMERLAEYIGPIGG